MPRTVTPLALRTQAGLKPQSRSGHRAARPRCAWPHCGSAAGRRGRFYSNRPARMRQHGVDLAGVRGQVGFARYRRAAIAARHVVEQTLELVEVLLDGLPELGIGAIFAADFVERLCPWAV